MKRKIILLFTVVFASCNNHEHAANSKDSVAAETVQADVITIAEVEGVYRDTMPCADCAGILTTIQLSADSTYLMEQEYLGKKGTGFFYNLGRWKLKDSIVTLSKIKDAPNSYKASLNSLLPLDKDGKEIRAAHLTYSLNRIANKNFKTKQNIPLEGLFTYYADTHLFTVCATGKTYPAALTKETVPMERDYGSLKKGDKMPLLANVEGIFEMRPGIEGDKQEETFVIKKFIKFLPGENCKEGE